MKDLGQFDISPVSFDGKKNFRGVKGSSARNG